MDEIQDRTGHKLIRKYGRRDNTGVIGSRILRGGGSPQTKPGTIYWNALRTWELLARDPSLETTPPQSWVHGRWSTYTVPAKGPEVDSVKGVLPLFEDPPPPPFGWSDPDRELSFDLSRQEVDRILRGWARAAGGDTLMSRLAQTGAKAPDRMTSRRVMRLCDPAERRSLQLADRAGALVGIGRALYAAMVHDLKRADQQTGDNGSAAALRDVVARYGELAIDLEIDALARDIPIPTDLVDFLRLVQAWIRDGGDFLPLRPAFLAREFALKDDRALLLDHNAKRRADWRPRLAQPLTYRWEKVSAFLDQLATAA